MAVYSEAVCAAIIWLQKHGGDAAFDKHGVAFACGETAPYMRSTWNKCRDLGLLEFYNPAHKGYGRLKLTEKGQQAQFNEHHGRFWLKQNA